MRFQSVFAAFLFIFIASVLALVVFVQSESFGKVFSHIISDVSQRKANAEVSMQNLSISLFPPGLELNRVRVSRPLDKGSLLRSELGKVGIYLSFIELEEQQFSFGEVRISDAVVEVLQSQAEDSSQREVIDEAVIDQSFNLLDQFFSQIGTLVLENTKVIFGEEIFEAKRFKLFRNKKEYSARLHFANLRPWSGRFSVDEVWADLRLSKSRLDVQRLKLQHDVHSLLLTGSITDYRLLSKASVDLRGEGQVHLKNIHELFNFPEKIEFNAGVLELSFGIHLENEVLKADADAKIRKLRSNLLSADELSTNLLLTKDAIQITELSLNNDSEKLRLLAPASVYRLADGRFLPQPLRVSVEDLSLNNVLRYLGPSLKVLKGKLTGVATVSRTDTITIVPESGFKVTNLGLVVGKSKAPFQILMTPQAILSNAEFAIHEGEFSMAADVRLSDSKLSVNGRVNAEEVYFNVPDADVNLEDLGDIAKLGIKGKSRLDVTVRGPLSDTQIAIQGKSQDFEVLGFFLGATEKDLVISLKDESVIIQNVEADVGKTHLSGTGAINYNNLDIALGINSRQARGQDLMLILAPIFSKLDFLPSDLSFTAKIDAGIHGKALLSGLKVRSNVSFRDLTAWGEVIEKGQLGVELANRVISLQNLDAQKGPGQIFGDFSFDLLRNVLALKYRWENLALSSFEAFKKLKLNLEGKFAGGLHGQGTLNDFKIDLKNTIFDTRSSSHKFQDSVIDVQFSPSYLRGSASLFGEYLSSSFDLALKSTNQSSLRLDLNIPDFKPLLVAVLGQQLASEDFSGHLKFGLHADFGKDFRDLNLDGNLQRLGLRYSDININHFSTERDLRVKAGEVEKWFLNVRQPDLYFTSTGQGMFGKELRLEHEFHLNAKLLELFIAPILSAEGFVRNYLTVTHSATGWGFRANFKGSDITLSLEQLPIPITNLRYDFDYADRRLTIGELTSSLETGSVALKGDVYFDGDEPDVNIKYLLDKAEIPILGKSLINLSGEGILLGNSMPYTLSGEILINKAQIINELSEFNSKGTALSQVRFLPKNQESPVGKLLALNLSVKADNNIRLSNSLMDVSLLGELRLSGSPTRPRAEGRLYSPLNISRVFFKNTEYTITNADINFSPRKEITNPDFDVQAQAFISSYKVTAKAYGDLERFNFDLTSDPTLSKNSILSLIALGYTDEIQNTLRPDDQQSLTQVGMGSFVFDRFKISDILNRQFGLQVNLGSVFEQSQSESLLSGRSQEGQNGGLVGRTRSATKIELRKRLNEATSLSVSSTMGGSIGQRQSMNLTYGISKKVQLEGVYELRTNAEGEEDIIDNSIGADLKFRWTFK